MKNFLNLNQLSMSWNEKQKPQRFRRYAVMLMMLLTLGVGQMWGYETFKEVWVTYNTGGSDQGAAGSSDQSLGNVSQFVIKAFYLNCRDNWGAGRTCWNGGGLYYSTDGGANYTEVVNNATTWKKNGWTEDDYQFRKESMSVTLISSTAASGNYTIKFKGKVWGNHDTWINSGNASTWTMSVLPPALNSFTITPTGAVAGSGTSSDPYIIPYGGDLTLVSSGGSKARTDANSTVQFSLNNSTWGTSTTYTTKTISNVTSTDKASVNLYAKCYNSTASLSGAVKTQTIYYRAAALKTITLKKGTDGTSDGSMTIREYATAYTAYTAATKTNWSLKGYYTDASSGTQIIDKDGNLLSNKSGYTNSDGQWIGGDKTLHAQWNNFLSVTYDGNENTGGSAPTDATEYASGDEVTVASAPVGMVKTGYSFAGWNTAPGGGGTSYAAGATFNISANTTLYAQWTENKTAVTISASPAGTGTFTVNSVSGTSASVGVTTTATVVATPATDFQFTSWAATNCSASPTNNKSTTLTGNGSSATGTLVATFTENVASGWYLIGDDFGGQWNTSSRGYPLNKKYRGMEGVFYRQASVSKDKYHCVHNTSIIYTPNENNPYFAGSGWSNKIHLNHEGTYRNVRFSAAGTYYIVLDTRGTYPYIWYETSEPDRFNYHSVNVTGVDNAKGTCKVTLGSTSGFETTRFANGETFYVTITGVSGYIPTITIGGTPTTWWKEQATYTASGTMSTSDVAVTISYTASYAVTFAKTTGCGTLTATGPSSTTISTGDKVKSGTSITFTQTATNAGYDFSKWYSTSTGTGGTDLGGDANGVTKSITAATSVYPIYTTHTFTGGTLDKKEGSANGSYSVTYLTTSFASKTAPTRTGYNVSGYYKETGRTTLIADASGNLQKNTTYTNSSKQWTYTSSIPTLYTKWTAKQYNITLDKKEGSTNGSAKVKYDATSLTDISAPTRTGYHVTGYYGETGRTNMVANASGALQSNVSGFTTGTKWSKDADGTVTLYTKWAANTYTIAFNANDDNYVGTATGSTASIAATYGTSYTLTTNGFAREGYTFDRWTSNADGTGTSYTDGQTGVSNLTSTNGATVTLYAKWTPKTYTVTLNARGGTCATKNTVVTMGSTYGAGTAGPLPSPTPPAGQVFSGWYTSAGGGTLVESTTQVTTASDHTLYAHYTTKAQVYFKNTLGWSKVYVVYDANWDGSQGTGSQDEQGHERFYREMTKVAGTSDVYYDNIPDEYITSWRWNIAFNNTYQYDYHAFTEGEAVFRYDFDRKSTMFVPTNATGSTDDGNYLENGVQYRSTGYPGESSGPKYTSGYWRTYNNTYSGYTMTYQKNGDSGWSSGHKMESSNVSSNVFIYTVHMDANSQYNFAFYKEHDENTKSVRFNYRTQITSTACTDLKLVCDPNNAWMWTTVEGDYVFKLEMKNDGHMYLTVVYPFAVGDYRVRYDYTKGSAQHYYSEIIKGRANGLDTISVFIHSADSASSRALKIERCTAISASGSPSWNTDYATITLPEKTAAGQTYDGKTTSGVYNFIISQDGSMAASGAFWKKHDGNYYIRTDVSDGGWDLYKYRTDNIMTLSEYSLTQTLSPPYSHYYCRFIGSAGADITYCIATDYSPNISGTMIGDETIGGVGNRTLPATANVRFTWNMETNALRRAYLKNAQNENERFLVLHGKADDNIFNNDASGTAIAADPGRSLAKNELLFEDLGNWIYQVELKAKPNAAVSLIAKYNNADRYLIGSTSSWMTIMGGSGSAKYEILAVYDFKTNRLMTVWKPSGDITQTLSDVDVLLIRHAQEAGQAITFNGGSLTTKKVYGALEFRYDELVGHVTNWTSDSRPLMKFFISFPFDVNVSDIFGLNSAYGDAYEIQMYDGAERARKGFFRGDGTTTFWKTLQPGDVMKANEGYCVIMDNDYLNNDVGHVWDNKGSGSTVYLYFPSAGNVGSIASTSQTISIPSRPCTIDRTFTTHQGSTREVNHINTDSHWNMMGVPIFDTHSDPGTSGQPGAVFATSGTDGDGNFNYFYEWNPSNNQYSIHTAVNYSFMCMHGYMVQYHGNVTFKTAAAPASVAARRAPQKENYQIELQVLNNNADVLNSAFVELRENACDTFELNEDVYMSFNNLAVNIYTLAGNYDVAANVLSVGNHTIPVCVEVTKAGTYTFSMPSNFSGTATLVDSFTGERTNLALDDYEVNLQKGVIEDRFLLEIDVQKVATAIDGASGEGSLKDGKAHKFLQNNTLYILQNGVLYDARGARVQ